MDDYKVGDTVFFYDSGDHLRSGKIERIEHEVGGKPMRYIMEGLDCTVHGFDPEQIYPTTQAAIAAGSKTAHLFKDYVGKAAAILMYALDATIDEVEPNRLWELTMELFREERRLK